MDKATTNPKHPSDEFEDILGELARLRAFKVQQRGESKDFSYDTPVNFERVRLGLWADIHRKYERIDRYLFDGAGGDSDLEDDFKDLANYAIKGLQLLRRGRLYVDRSDEVAVPEVSSAPRPRPDRFDRT